MLPMSTCSLCAPNVLLGAYLQANWRHTTVGEIDYSQFYSCKHVNAAISWISHKVIPRPQLPDEDSARYKEEVAKLLTGSLVLRKSRQEVGYYLIFTTHSSLGGYCFIFQSTMVFTPFALLGVLLGGDICIVFSAQDPVHVLIFQ